MNLHTHRIVQVSRRAFVKGVVTTAGCTLLGSVGPMNRAATHGDVSLAGRIYKTLKFGMVRVEGTLVEKFRAVRDAGFDGIEMNSPGMNVEETRRAIAETGLPVDGTVCSTHWNIRHTSPDPNVRDQALRDLETALRDTHAVGGHTVLLVAGHGQDGPETEIWPRAVENISRAIPLAAKLGVCIAIENVWNHFLYDHDGGPDQTADKFVAFIDQFHSPWVGMQFDIGNHWKYGNPATWIRQLGKRIVKLDVKGFSRQHNRFTAIEEGDIPWSEVRQALADIGYAGWAAAEVAGGNQQVLRQIASAMDQVFRLA